MARWLLLLSLTTAAMFSCGAPMMVVDAGEDPSRWSAVSPFTLQCPYGRFVRVSCNPACGGAAMSCANDPVLRVCDAGLSDMRHCARGTNILAENDNSCGNNCASAEFDCPMASAVTLLARSAQEGRAFVCTPSIIDLRASH